MDTTLKDIISEGEVLKSRTPSQNDSDLSYADYVDSVYDDVRKWIEKAKEFLSSNYPNHNIDLDDPTWDSIMSRSCEALNGFIEHRLQKLRPLLNSIHMTYDEIMAALLQAYEAHPEMDVEEIIAQVARKIGASDKSLESIKASSVMLDKFQEKKTALEAAHEDGETTKKWILAETARMTENRTDEEKAIIADAIVETVNHGVKQSLTEGQNNKEE